MAYGRKRSYSSGRPGSAKRAKYSRRRAPYRARVRRNRKSRRSGRSTVRTFHNVTGNRSVVNIKGLGLPQTLITRLAYRETDALSTGTGGTASLVQFRLGSLYDPYLTGAGGQPRYFDQLCSTTMYKQYLVYRADVTLSLRNRSSSDIMTYVQVRPDATVPSTVQVDLYHDAELPYSASRILNGVSDGGPANRTVYKFTIRPHLVHGITKSKYYSDPDYSATYNTSPTNATILTFGFADDPNETVAALAGDYELSIVYYVKFFGMTQAVPDS